jgi:polysaccharide chain length determinant protein (PEP-CTERM system associated)
MIGHREMSMDDYVAILRRHLWVIVIPTLLLPVVAYLVSLALPERYTSQTLVLVEQPRVPTQFVPTVVTDQLNERLQTMQQQILSRTRLQPIIEKFGLYREDVAQKVPMEDLIGRMRQSIQVTPVKPVTTVRQGEIPGFTISFEADNPRMAQLVCQEITSMFIAENLKLRTERAEGTTEFLQKQVEEAKQKLDEKDARLAEFKRKYLGQLPGQEQVNMNILMGLTQQLEAVNQLLTRTHQDKTYAESQLDQQIAAWEAAQVGSNPLTLEQQLAALQTQLLTMESRYTPDHPDMIKLKADIAQMKKKIDENNAAAKAKPADKDKADLAKMNEPPNIQQLRNLIHGYDLTIQEKTRDQERLQDQIRTYRARVEISPLVEQQYNEITRDFATAQGFYDELLRKKSQSAVAADLERQQQSEQFRLWDPPNLPEKPTFPNRLLFAGGGLGGGLVVGLGLALLLELKDKALRTERDVEVLLQLPTLALVPSISRYNGKGRGGLFSRIRKTDERALPRAGA